jgi:hypothetical protein
MRLHGLSFFTLFLSKFQADTFSLTTNFGSVNESLNGNATLKAHTKKHCQWMDFYLQDLSS